MNYKKLIFTLLILLLSVYCFCQTNEEYKLWESYIDEGVELTDVGKYQQALVEFSKCYNISKKIFKENEEELGEIAFELAYTHEVLGNYKEAIAFYLETLNNFKLNSQEKEPHYTSILYRIGEIYRISGEFEKSLKTLQESLKLIEATKGKKSIEFANTILSISIVNKKKGDYGEAIKNIQTSNKIIEELFGDQNSKYAKNLTSLSQVYIEMGQYNKALETLTEALSYLSENDINSIDYIQAVFTKGVLFHNLYEYEKEIAIYEYVKKISKKNGNAYISANNNLAVVYEEIGDYEKALTISIDVLNNTPEDDSNYPIRLQNLAYSYGELGEFKKAMETYEKALVSCRKLFGTSHQLYADLIDCIGQLYYNNGDFVKAKEMNEETLSVFLKNFSEEHSEYGFYLNHYTNTLLALNQYNEAIDLMIKNIKISEVNSNTNNIVYYRKQLSLANAYNMVGKYKEALLILENYSEKVKLKLGNQHEDYGEMQKIWWTGYLGLGDFEKAIPLMNSSNNVLISQINKVFKFRSENEKKSFVKTTTQNFDELQSVAYQLSLNHGKLNTINLDNQMILKGLLLNNSKNLLTELTALNNSEINKKIANYRLTKTVLSNMLNLPSNKRDLNVDSLKIRVNEKESELVKLYTTHVNSNIDLSKNWKNSQLKLESNDMAIEFSHFNYSYANKITDSIIYVAYVFNKDWEYPKMIPLFEEKQLKTILSKKSPNQLYTSRGAEVVKSINAKAIYDLVWDPLEKYVESSDKIYYAPSGLLNQISFAALGKENDVSLCNKYNLVQLSSTSVLTDKAPEPNKESALFIGGVDYNYNAISAENNDGLKESETIIRKLGNWTYLPGTLKEVNSLQDILKTEGGEVSSLTGTEATEANFKNISGKSPSILHIATHGFFYENLNSKKQGESTSNLNNQYRIAEDPLLRSGLIFAGANLKSGNQTDNGILTAMEISNMDLSSTDIVLLSACETGLGDIEGSEGVYGLQRAFKMAGVNIVVMSLWQVPDVETAEFMELFYKNWLQSKQVKEAFNKAQRNMQEKYKTEPEKWAAFVLFE